MIDRMLTGIQVRLAESRDQVPLEREAWNALAACNPTRTAFQTFEWFDTWWAAFGQRHNLFLMTVHEGDRAIGIVPMMLVRGPLGLRQLEFTGIPNSDYQDVILPERRQEAVSAVCKFLHSRRKRWDMVVFRDLPERSPTAGEFTAAFEGLGLGVMNLERQPCPAVLLRGHESEIHRMLDRYSLRRRIRRLEQRGPLRYHVFTTMDEIDQALPVFFEQHIQRWRETGTPSPFSDAAFQEWYCALARAAFAGGWLHFSRLECAGKPAAFHFGFQFGRTLSWYKPSFDWDFHRESPGTVLIRHLIEEASSRGLDELDFSSGLEGFKLRFANSQSINLNLRVFSRSWLHRGFIAGARLRQVARRIWHGLRRSSSAGQDPS